MQWLEVALDVGLFPDLNLTTDDVSIVNSRLTQTSKS